MDITFRSAPALFSVGNRRHAFRSLSRLVRKLSTTDGNGSAAVRPPRCHRELFCRSASRNMATRKATGSSDLHGAGLVRRPLCARASRARLGLRIHARRAVLARARLRRRLRTVFGPQHGIAKQRRSPGSIRLARRHALRFSS